MEIKNVELLVKYVGVKSMMTINLFTQASSAVKLSFERYKSDRQVVDSNAALGVTMALIDARFFCEGLGWCALLLRRLRHETEIDDLPQFLIDNKSFIDQAYEMRKLVNHSYNEDLADSYRKDNYKDGLHKDKFAFAFELDKDKSVNKFTLGTTEIDMDKFIKELTNIETGLLNLRVPRSGSYKSIPKAK